MNPIRALLAGHNASRRPRARRLGLESLEGRQVLSALGTALVGPLAVSKAASTSAASSTTAYPDSNQSGKAFSFNMEWDYAEDTKTGVYYLNIQDQAHADATTSVIYIERQGDQIVFALTPTGSTSDSVTYVDGPVVGANTHFTERVFSDSWGFAAGKDWKVIDDVGSPVATFDSLPRTVSGSKLTVPGLAGPNGSTQVNLTYEFDGVTDTGTIEVTNNAWGNNLIDYSIGMQSESDGPPADSPSANPWETINFQVEGGGNQDDNAAVNVFVPGLANPKINVTVDNTGFGYDTFVNKALTTTSGAADGMKWTAVYNPLLDQDTVQLTDTIGPGAGEMDVSRSSTGLSFTDVGTGSKYAGPRVGSTTQVAITYANPRGSRLVKWTGVQTNTTLNGISS